MPSPANLPLADLLARAHTAFQNARATPDVLAALTPYGYDATRLDTLQALVEEVSAKHATHGAEYADQFAATGAADRARVDLVALYTRHRQLARVAYKRSTEAYRSLALDGPVPRQDAALLAHADTFYRVLQMTPALAAPLATLSLGADAIADGLVRVEAALRRGRPGPGNGRGPAGHARP